jgi:ectoine hydroxylase-related dioxygenase (phytanoyl-CoA dioxygenase family)
MELNGRNLFYMTRMSENASLNVTPVVHPNKDRLMPNIIDAVTESERLHQDGCLIIRKLIDPPWLARLHAAATTLVQRRLSGGVVAEVAKTTGEPPDPVNCFHCNHPDYWSDRNTGLVELLRTAVDPRIMALPRIALGADAMYRCMSIWFTPQVDIGQGAWHRDIQFYHKNNLAEEQNQFLLGRSDEHHMVQVQIALTASDHVELVPGSHRQWDTPEQLAVRHGDQGARAKGPGMPGAVRVVQEPGDAVLFRNVMMHRGNYDIKKPRLTLMLSYMAKHACQDTYFTQQRWFLRPGYLDGLDDGTRKQYERFIAGHRYWWTAQLQAKVG